MTHLTWVGGELLAGNNGGGVARCVLVVLDEQKHEVSELDLASLVRGSASPSL